MPAPVILGYNAGLDLSAADEWHNAPDRYIQPAPPYAPIRAQVVVEEDHSDDLIITEHPVEGGSEINDHAFKRPAELRVRMGWSNAYADQFGHGDVKAIYTQILELQASRTPFAVYTGKRVYQNMLIASLRTQTDQKTAYSFIADIEFKEVILVNTQVIVTGGVYNSTQLADAQGNTAITIQGPVQAQLANVDQTQDEWTSD